MEQGIPESVCFCSNRSICFTDYLRPSSAICTSSIASDICNVSLRTVSTKCKHWICETTTISDIDSTMHWIQSKPGIPLYHGKFNVQCSNQFLKLIIVHKQELTWELILYVTSFPSCITATRAKDAFIASFPARLRAKLAKFIILSRIISWICCEHSQRCKSKYKKICNTTPERNTAARCQNGSIINEEWTRLRKTRSCIF